MKPGYQTSEMWMVIFGSLLTALNQKTGLNIPPSLVLGLLGLIGAYVINRWHLKSLLLENGNGGTVPDAAPPIITPVPAPQQPTPPSPGSPSA